jgi:hypothetical protein
MITDAKIISAGAECRLDWGTPETRRREDYAVTPMDLVLFGQSPARWVLRAGREPDEGVGKHTLLRASVLAPNGAGARHIPTPETYKVLRQVCPKCGSENLAATCRRCGIPRVSQVMEKPWAPQAQSCKRWTEDVVSKGLVPVSRALNETNDRMHQRINADPHAASLLQESQKLLLITGTWTGQDPDQTLPVRALIDVAPGEGHGLCGTLATLLIVPDISPGAWQSHLVKGGHHLQSALARQLFHAATGEDITSHLWLLVEAREPHLVGRRRSTPELDKLAAETCERLLERMWFCRRWDLWPNFDPLCSGALPAWTETYLEDWMTQAGAGASGYWALDGVDRAKHANEQLARAA